MTDSSDEEDLREHLTICAKLYLTSDIDSQRLAVTSALFELAKHFERRAFPPEALLPILRPAMALAGRENNALDPLFSQRPRDGRPSATTTAHLRTAMLSVLANAWLKLHEGDGRTQPEKLVEAARELGNSGIKDVTGAALKTARETVSQEAKDHPAVEFSARFNAFYDKVAAEFGRKRAFGLMARYIVGHEVNAALGILKTRPVSGRDNDR